MPRIAVKRKTHAVKKNGGKAMLITISAVLSVAALGVIFIFNQDAIINGVYYMFHPDEKSSVIIDPLPTPVISAKDETDNTGTNVGGQDTSPGEVSDTILISAVGDLAVHEQQLEAAKNEETGLYDFSGVFADIKPYLEKADILIGDLYTTVSGEEVGYSGYPKFNTPKSFLEALKAAGFDVLITANNRSFDHGWLGVTKTIENIKGAGMKPVGTYLDSNSYYVPDIIEAKGFKVAVLAYTQSVDSTSEISADKQSFCIKQINKDSILRDIAAAQSNGAEIIIVSMHWGEEDTREPDKDMRALAESILGAGADMILGTHPQMLQAITFKDFEQDSGGTKKCLVAYSLGNFISNKRNRYNDTGAILSVEFNRDAASGKVSIGNASLTPTWIYAADTEVAAEKNFKVLPLNKYLSDEALKGTLYDSAVQRMTQAKSEFADVYKDGSVTLAED